MNRLACAVFVGCCVIACCFSAARAQEPGATSGQREFTARVPLLDEQGVLQSWGWARRAIFDYNRQAIPAERHPRIKEWEHYTIMTPDFTVGGTIVQLGRIVAGSAELIDYRAQTTVGAQVIVPVRAETPILPADPHGVTRLSAKENFIELAYADEQRRLECHFNKTRLSAAIAGEIVMDAPAEGQSVAITRPFAEPGQFFYENKIFGMPARGSVTVDGRTFELPEGESWAIYDWGRGIWPSESSWFWGQAAGRAGDRRVALNLGHGYGDDAQGTCNALLVDGQLHKLDQVTCEFDPSDRMKPWRFASNDGRLTLDFTPIYQQHSKQDLGFASAELFKIHGRYSGTVVLDDETPLVVKDLLGFAEHMEQRW